jgi:hypothetical protein
MKAFFDRHQKNKKVDSGKKAGADKGQQAWLLWGGDAGRAWATKIVGQMEKADKKKPINRALNPCGMSEGGTFVKGNTCAGTKGKGKREKLLADFKTGKITASQLADYLLPPEQRKSYKKPPKKTLSPEPKSTPSMGQNVYFKDSKVRDKDGELLTVYHGTLQEFDAFENPHGGWNMFSDNFEYSRVFAKGKGEVLEVNLNIKKPLDLRSLPRMRGDARNELIRLLKYKAELDEDSIRYLKKHLPYEKDLFAIINQSRDVLISPLIDAGYDGIIMPDIVVGQIGDSNDYGEILGDTYIAFVANQIKLTSNKSPTSNKAINRALNPCGMSEGGTFAKGNSCAGTKGTGKKAKAKTADQAAMTKWSGIDNAYENVSVGEKGTQANEPYEIENIRMSIKHLTSRKKTPESIKAKLKKEKAVWDEAVKLLGGGETELSKMSSEEVSEVLDYIMENDGGYFTSPQDFDDKLKEELEQNKRDTETLKELQAELDEYESTQPPKVTFQTGEPFVAKVYHGTPYGGFDTFDKDQQGVNTKAGSATLGWFFAGSRETAQGYAGTSDDFRIKARGWNELGGTEQQELIVLADTQLKTSNDDGTDYPSFEDITDYINKNPEEIRGWAEDHLGEEYDTTPVQPEVKTAFVKMQNPYVVDQEKAEYREETYYDLMLKAIANGHDGIVITNTYDSGYYDTRFRKKDQLENVFAVFNKKSIKLLRERAVQRALNPCGMSEGGTFAKGNSCAGTKGTGKKAKIKGQSKVALQTFKKNGVEFISPNRDPEQYRKFTPVTGKNSDFIGLPTQEKIHKYLNKKSVAKMVTGKNEDGSKLAGDEWMKKHAGKLIKARIDIPTYKASTEKGDSVYAVTLHENDRKQYAGAYIPMAVLSNVTFKDNDLGALYIQEKIAGKTPLATVVGTLDYDATINQKIPDDIDSWTPVGYNPSHSTFFYDKRTGKEVTGGAIAISVGNTVFVKNPKYAKGGRSALNKRESQSIRATESRIKKLEKSSAYINKKQKRPEGIYDLDAISELHDLFGGYEEEVKRALNPCGMSKGGTFTKGNSCAGTKGTGKSKPKKPKRQPKKYTREGWKKSLNDWMDRNNLDSSKFWNKDKGRVELPDMETIKAIAEEQAQGKPDEATKQSYEKFKKHLMSQYDALVDSGLIVKAWKGDGEPYKVSEEKMWVPSSKKMREKVEETGVFYFFMTDKGFGEGQTDKAHPFLQMSSAKTADGEPMLYNDVFRVVHDAVAHLNGGYSFSTRGEMNAMLAHASTLPKDTWSALWAETFAQNAYYEVNKKFAPQNYYTSKYVNMIEELQEQSNKQAKVSRADMPIKNEDEGCGCNRRRRAVGARFRYYAKRFLESKTRPDIKRFTSNPAKKKKKGKTGGCGNSGQGFVEGNTCATGSPAGPTTAMKEAEGKQPFQSDIHPKTEQWMDSEWAKRFAGKQEDVSNPEELTKLIAKEIRKKEKDHDIFLVPIDKQGELNGQIVNVDSRLLLGDGTSQDAMGLLNGEYRLEFIKVENSPLRDMKNRDTTTAVRKDNPKRGKRFKAASRNMSARQTAKLAEQILKGQRLTKVEQDDLQKYIQYKVDKETLAEEAKKKKSAAKKKDPYAFPKKKKKKKPKAKPKTKKPDDFDDAISEALSERNDDPCWETHEQVGMKSKNGKQVPNCVPKKRGKNAK